MEMTKDINEAIEKNLSSEVGRLLQARLKLCEELEDKVEALELTVSRQQRKVIQPIP